jgi:hypothetical protein
MAFKTMHKWDLQEKELVVCWRKNLLHCLSTARFQYFSNLWLLGSISKYRPHHKVLILHMLFQASNCLPFVPTTNLKSTKPTPQTHVNTNLHKCVSLCRWYKGNLVWCERNHSNEAIVLCCHVIHYLIFTLNVILILNKKKSCSPQP